MNSQTGIQEPKTRRACEPCRRKKTKCTAEKPVCSFCTRLNQSCYYLPRDQLTGEGKSSRVTKSTSNERVKSLESQVGQIYDILHSLSNRNDDGAGQTTTSFQLPNRRSSSSTSDANLLSEPSTLPINPPVDADIWSPSNPEPPAEALSHLVEIYRTKIYFQPLPLLSLNDLRARVPLFPPFLRWSFLALCVHYSENDFYRERESQAIDFYTTASLNIVMNLAAEGVATTEVTQALCLLALGDIMSESSQSPLLILSDLTAEGNKQIRAWMTIGTATRLESLRMLTRQSSPKTSSDDSYSRCYWSIFTLEKAFSPTITVLDRLDNLPPFPPSPPLPTPVPGHNGEVRFVDVDNTESGIIAPSLQIISIWGDVTAYLSAIRHGKTEIPWSSNSTYSLITVKLQEFEIELSPPHRFENILVRHRSPSELHNYREYWTPWTIMQLSSHAALAVLNHPFIHLVALRDKNRKSQPKLFLQQVVDQALFHTGWVIRLLQTFEEMQLEVNDPLMGHQVAVTAIIPWLFQFAQDQQIAKKAREGLYLCERFLERISFQWPHIRQKLQILRELHSAAEKGTGSSTVILNTAIFWKIFDSPPSCSMSGDCSTAAAPSTSTNDPNATLLVTTKFVQSWHEEQSRQNVSQVDPPFFSSAEESDSGGQVSLDDFFSQFAIDEVLWSQPGMTSFTP